MTERVLVYAGIGSRETPDYILSLMTALAVRWHDKGWILRSGGARGADSAFEKGAGDLKEIFYAKDATQPAIELAASLHPAWDKCSGYARMLHGRNAMILLGRNLDSPVDFVTCWTPSAALVGGTGMALRIAKDRGIKVYNLGDYDMEIRARSLFPST